MTEEHDRPHEDPAVEAEQLDALLAPYHGGVPKACEEEEPEEPEDPWLIPTQRRPLPLSREEQRLLLQTRWSRLSD